MKKLSEKKRAQAKANAKYFGSECQANAGSTFIDYKDSIAHYYGYKRWDNMPLEYKDEALEAWREGVKREKELQKLAPR